MIKLKPCPFCGERVRVRKNDYDWWFIYHKCSFGITVKKSTGTTKEKAIKSWNTRTP